MTKSEKSSAINRLQQKWDEIHRANPEGCLPKPAHVLQSHDCLLPSQGTAIDLACGLGGNALYLAKKGLQTQAWDLSPVAIARLERIAEQEGLDICCEVRDLETTELPHRRWDVIVITRFLDRELNKQLADALRPGGLLYFQTFIRAKDPSIGPGNPAYLLAENELLRTFSDLVIRAYCETGQTGDLSKGFRNEAFLVAQKPRPK